MVFHEVRFYCISFTTRPLLDENGEPLFPITLITTTEES